MRHSASISRHPDSATATPWALHAWPPLLWQARKPQPVHFHHVSTRVATNSTDSSHAAAGQTVWTAHAADGDAGMAWDWIEIARGVVALADPMSLVTNVRLIGDQGEVLTAQQSALFLNELVRELPWQAEVQRALAQ